MPSQTTGRPVAFRANLLRLLAALALVVLAPALAACTTVEGTNALVDPGTFEREVMDPTLQGLDIIPQDSPKADPRARAPLVMPKQTAVLPAPTQGDTAALPVDSQNPQISTAGLSQADLARLRNARVVDLNTLAGRPLTDVERRQLTARMEAADMPVTASNSRPLTLPPASYFSTYRGKDTVCKATDGTLVALNDPRCPKKIRDALSIQAPSGSSITTEMNAQEYNMQHGLVQGDAGYR